LDIIAPKNFKAWVLQEVDLDVEPTQALPLYFGAGFVHDLLLDLLDKALGV
jgi:hypothetical protein